VVEARPFARALEESIEIALAEDEEYTLFLDGDVLLRQGAVEEMVLSARATKTRFYKMGFRILDWGFCGPTYGVHLYRTELFRLAKQFVRRAYIQQRPETYICMEMANLGYPAMRQTYIAGLHDYEQYNRDIYRKSFVRACKFNKYAGYLLSRCIGCESDSERRVMLWGLRDGLLYFASHDSAPLDVEFYRERASTALRECGVAEKDPLDSVADEFIEGTIQSFSPDELYLSNRAWLSPEAGVIPYGRNRGWLSRMRKGARRAVCWVQGLLRQQAARG
jgi:hypothetical protein